MNFPERKNIRLNGYDYSQNGLYFITVCTKDKQEILWSVCAGDGVLDVPNCNGNTEDILLCCAYELGEILLSEYGIIVGNQIVEMNNIYSAVKINQYVIMPNHIHFIIEVASDNKLNNGTSRSPSPTNAVIPAFISTFKRFVNKQLGFNIFQRSYHDHIIRSETEYKIISKYISENPQNWEYDCYNSVNENKKFEVPI